MRLLVDTHVLLWALLGDPRLGAETTAVLGEPSNEVMFSAASIWEIAIKAGLGRADFAVDAGRVLDLARKIGFAELPLRGDVATRVQSLPMHHRDPFDRLLIAQALSEPMRFFTADERLTAYSDLVTLVP